MDTIFALATAPARSGVSVIRVSGPNALHSASLLTGKVPEHRRAELRQVHDLEGQFVDEGLILGFQAPASFTGEDVVEFQLHGSPAVIQAMLKTLSGVDGCRLADPGEFTRRAFENGKLILSEIEGLADLIDAETEAQRRQANRLLQGELGSQVEKWRALLIHAAMLVETSIDFSDEEIPDDLISGVLETLSGLKVDFENELSGSRVAERIRNGFEVAIVGAPNAGKSTLLNAIARREAAITSDVAGTTRDVIEVSVDVNGFPVTFLDTAGIRETDDEVESLGVTRARDRASDADLRVFLGTEELGVCRRAQDLCFTPKGDLRGNPKGSISGHTGFGVDGLLQSVGLFLRDQAASVGYVVRERHRVAVGKSLSAIYNSLEVLASGSDSLELAAEEIRTATTELEVLIGKVGVEDLLDEIFLSFCLGK